MKKLIYIYILSTVVLAQTGIITSDGFQGFGVWAKLNKPFSKEKEIFYNYVFDYYSPIGIELTIGISQTKGLKSWNSIGAGYHYKLRSKGINLAYSKNLYDTFDFNKTINSFDYYSITLYRTSKLNPFVKISKINGFGEKSSDTEGGVNNSIDYFTLGGLGRITRFVTLSGSIHVPITTDTFNINNANIEASLGIVY